MEKKNLLNKAKNLVNVAQARTALALAAAASVMGPTVLAAGSDPKTLIQTIIGTIVKIFPFVGAFFVVSGVFKLVMAYRNDQPEAQSAAAKDIVIGAVFIVFALFIWQPINTAMNSLM
jgi:hypothetical protein